MVTIPNPEKLARAMVRLREKMTKVKASARMTCPCCGAELQITAATIVPTSSDGGAK